MGINKLAITEICLKKSGVGMGGYFQGASITSYFDLSILSHVKT